MGRQLLVNMQDHPFLKTGTTLALFHSPGIVPVASDSLKEISYGSE